MIKALIYRNKQKNIYGFKTNDHGDALVCAAVSTLCINAINSIEALSELDFECDLEDDGGFLHFVLPSVRDGAFDKTADILLRSMLLGLTALENDYAGQISVEYEDMTDEEVQ